MNSLPLVARLRQHTSLAKETSNETRWSSAFDMFQLYLEIEDYIDEIYLDNLDIFLLLLVENREAEVLLKELKNIKSISKQLQK